MPHFRPEIAALNPYQVGRRIEDVARELGLDPDSIIKLTANESPEGPFPGVAEAVAVATADANRYPDNDLWDLSHSLAAELRLPRESFLFGAGSTALIAEIASALGGPGTSIIYGWPSFVMYRFAGIWAGSAVVEVPLDANHELDLHAMSARINSDTRVVVLCNPNNPTGTIKPASDIGRFIATVPEEVLVVVDEAYHDFVKDDLYETAVPLAIDRQNVVVLRTFSKIYSLAGFRVGYAVGHPGTITQIRKAQAPLTLANVSQAAALASLGQPEELARRVEANATARHHLVGALAERGLVQAESHTNFIFFKMPETNSQTTSDKFSALGVILRPLSGGWMRVTVGTPEENQRFLATLDLVLQHNID